MTLGEVGNPPAYDILEKQPEWVYWVVWAGMVRGTSIADWDRVTKNPRILFMEDKAYLEGTAEFRKSCGFDPLTIDLSADFSGEWTLNECESSASSGMGQGSPYKLSVIQKDNILKIKSFSVSEYSDDEIAELSLKLDGTDNNSKGFMNSAAVQKAVWSSMMDTLTISTNTTINSGNRKGELKSEEVWVLKKRGKKLEIAQTSDGFGGNGKRSALLVYDKK